MMNIDAFILVGGRSSRLGHDKPFVEIGGITLVERADAIIRAGISPGRYKSGRRECRDVPQWP